MIDASSRYLTRDIRPVTDPHGVTRQTIFPAAPQSQGFHVMDYTWEEGDRVDLLAARMYGDETMWWVIGEANPEIMDWMMVSPGTSVRVPSGIS